MITTETLSAIVKTIIEHQQLLIGPLAIYQAQKVPGLLINDDHGLVIQIQNSDSQSVLNLLVNKYAELFGNTSIEACKEAIKELNTPVPAKELPDILK